MTAETKKYKENVVTMLLVEVQKFKNDFDYWTERLKEATTEKEKKEAIENVTEYYIRYRQTQEIVDLVEFVCD